MATNRDKIAYMLMQGVFVACVYFFCDQKVSS